MDRLNPADAAQDLDGDGFSNLEEFLLGSDPRVASSNFEIANTQPNGTDLQITFNSFGQNYRFERSDIAAVLECNRWAGTGGRFRRLTSTPPIRFPVCCSARRIHAEESQVGSNHNTTFSREPDLPAEKEC
jgi:hypothetical protein